MDSQSMIVELKKALEEARRKFEDARSAITQAEQDIQSLQGAIEFYERNLPMREIARQAFNVLGAVVKPLESVLQGMSHRQAVIAIAKHKGGVIKAQDAKQIMIRAGVMKNTKNSTHMVHNAIISSERFDRIGRGEYRLRVPSNATMTALATGVFPPKSPLQ
ncbi:MAG TPA: hypothetical protein VFO46_22465 [Candidatus Sulfotelmatobacter sp.]|nr:hypothetical protein [Candidatus Sulfotelmatobacter sp.]